MEKQNAYNHSWGLWLIFTFILVIPSVVLFVVEKAAFTIFFAIFLLLYLSELITRPYKYVFDDFGVTICYVTGVKQTFLWKNINSLVYKEIHTRRRSEFFYIINGKPESLTPYKTEPTIEKTKKINRLLNEYIGDRIVDFTAIPKYKKSNESLSEYVLKLEEFTRSNVENHCKNYSDFLYESRINFNLRFAYFSDEQDKKELKKRPEGSSFYAAIIEISKFGEEDKERIYDFKVELVKYNDKLKRQNLMSSRSILNMLSVVDNTIDKMKREGFETYMKF